MLTLVIDRTAESSVTSVLARVSFACSFRADGSVVLWLSDAIVGTRELRNSTFRLRPSLVLPKSVNFGSEINSFRIHDHALCQ